MRLSQDWHDALGRAQLGELAPARQARVAQPPSPLADYFYARCLTEAPPLEPDQYAEAIDVLARVVQAQPLNPLFLQTLILALARVGTVEGARQAAALWRRHGLPHDLDLLGQAALTLELQMRPLPVDSPAARLPWPEALPYPGEVASSAAPEAPVASPESDRMSPPLASNSPGLDSLTPLQPPEESKIVLPDLSARRRPSSGAIRRMEKDLVRHETLQALKQADALLATGREGAELHLLAGIAAEEAGAPLRARAHLGRAARLAPTMLLIRSYLARVYWRLEWLDLAIALWRSLPIEGPYDYGRHYHLALAHETHGDRPAALVAMRLATRDFFYDTRHFYVKRALERWLASHPE